MNYNVSSLILLEAILLSYLIRHIVAAVIPILVLDIVDCAFSLASSRGLCVVCCDCIHRRKWERIKKILDLWQNHSIFVCSLSNTRWLFSCNFDDYIFQRTPRLFQDYDQHRWKISLGLGRWYVNLFQWMQVFNHSWYGSTLYPLSYFLWSHQQPYLD